MIKGKIEETFRSKNLTSIPPAQQRVIFCGQILTPETLKVKEIQKYCRWDRFINLLANFRRVAFLYF